MIMQRNTPEWYARNERPLADWSDSELIDARERQADRYETGELGPQFVEVYELILCEMNDRGLR